MSIKVGYLGPDPVTFGYMAAEKHFEGQRGIEFMPLKSHADICRSTGRQELDYGIVACENYIDGAISETIRALDQDARQYGTRICAEVVIPIEHFLLCKTGGDGKLKKVLSHPSALRQCNRYLKRLLDEEIPVEAVESTGLAAKTASEDASIAAIGSTKAQELYSLTRLEENSIADLSGNLTRFWIIGTRFAPRTGKDKTAFLVNLEQEAVGVVYRSLGYFAQKGIGLLWLHANPIAGKHWEYTFLLEFKGHITDDNMASAYEELSESGLCLGGPLLLGSWPDKTSAG